MKFFLVSQDLNPRPPDKNERSPMLPVEAETVEIETFLNLKNKKSSFSLNAWQHYNEKLKLDIFSFFFAGE